MFIYKVKTSTLCGHTPALCIIVDKNKHTLCLESYNKYTFLSTFLPNILMMIYKMKTSTLCGQTPYIHICEKNKYLTAVNSCYAVTLILTELFWAWHCSAHLVFIIFIFQIIIIYLGGVWTEEWTCYMILDAEWIFYPLMCVTGVWPQSVLVFTF